MRSKLAQQRKIIRKIEVVDNWQEEEVCIDLDVLKDDEGNEQFALTFSGERVLDKSKTTVRNQEDYITQEQYLLEQIEKGVESDEINEYREFLEFETKALEPFVDSQESNG